MPDVVLGLFQDHSHVPISKAVYRKSRPRVSFLLTKIDNHSLPRFR